MARPFHAHHPSRQESPGRPAVGRAGSVAAVAAVLILAAWSATATIYILFKDEALQHLIERQVSITRSYEAQAAKLQAEIDRLRSLKLIDQERVDRAIADLARRQTAIENRHSAINALAAERLKAGEDASEFTGSIRSPVPEAPAMRPANRPTPLSDTILIAPPADRWVELQSRPVPSLGPSLNAREAATAAEVRLANLASDIRRLELAQSGALNMLEVAYDGRKRRIRKVLEEIGVHPQPTTRTAAENSRASAASGGPFLPWTRPPDDPLLRQVLRIREARTALRALEREIDVLPVRRPMAAEAEVTSAFGVRLDPFLRQPAMHTGIDFRGDTGEPVFAAASGRVVEADRNGGYGLMVEIDHGNGLTTRYAHLSAISVTAGQRVAAGDLIGRVGSTGRSTGPHLHYEVRLDGEATDPQRFLRAGLRLHEPL